MLASFMSGNACVSHSPPHSSLFYSPTAIKRSRSTGDRSPLLFVAIWTNACLWMFYGVFIEAIHPIATTNFTGFLSGSYFLLTFYAYASPVAKTRFAQYFVLALSFVLSTATYCFFFPSPDTSRTQAHLGALCTLVTIAVYAAPLSTVLRALRLRSPKPISLFFALVGTLNSVLWGAYGILTADAWVYIPSVLGVFMCLTQAAVFFWFAVGRGGLEGGKESRGEGFGGKALFDFLSLQGDGGKEMQAALL
ncbi:MtN3-like protein [Nannochloropsis gaditana]|uniref:MtN3-like protein n=1 Tax=Nannochloropsis gaditana TaxID=72520 RepID=W7TXR5_9STRA|nr:MtN3-like protein [Nannochloropsis gaditana]